MNNTEFNSQVKDYDTEIKEEITQIADKYPVDGYYAWVQVFAGLMVHFAVFGTAGSFGVYVVEYMNSPEFHGEPDFLLNFIGSLGPAIYAVVSIPSGILVSKIGHRINMLGGAIIFGVGLIIASFAQQVWTLFIGQALFLGVAISFCFIPAISIVPQWLDKHIGLGMGICAAGSGVGGLVLAPIVQVIIDSIGWRWALRINGIFGAIVLALCAITLQTRVPFKAPSIFDRDIITNTKFLALWGQGAITCFAYWVPFFLMPAYAQYHGISASTASLIVGLMNGASALGRIATGVIADKLGNINTLIISNLICSLSFILIWNFATVTWSLILFSLIFGFFSSALFTNSALLTPQLFGFEKLAQVNGMFYAGFAPGYLAGTISATAIVNLYTIGDLKNYLPMFFFLFGCYIASCIFLVLLRVQVTKGFIVKV
ncbi:MFS general substrate transporter [Conidiobolus coronatus NRRL 28638]|uniref:MFS general substrate transporter n=1 Tax=Conidiobolus coronatus (strain ATCC 28846 / CBS 209.66 / NRRL 28638) TaxID=796925 RepID=A0A137P080_CONC2|nr:MFS general substrate transporter [Conidiobolus coronatus NRRL 28638]|eukprot:KXN68483.1 MFS general substrate transporter [Conidiobolus coronatus NRRL 28638]